MVYYGLWPVWVYKSKYILIRLYNEIFDLQHVGFYQHNHFCVFLIRITWFLASMSFLASISFGRYEFFGLFIMVFDLYESITLNVIILRFLASKIYWLVYYGFWPVWVDKFNHIFVYIIEVSYLYVSRLTWFMASVRLGLIRFLTCMSKFNLYE